MASKKDVLDILDSDISEMRKAIRERHSPLLEKLEETCDALEDQAHEALVAVCDDAVKRLKFAKINASRRERADDLIGDYEAYRIDMKKIPGYVTATKQLKAGEAKRDKEYASLSKKSSAIRRRIMLHGVDDSVLTMLASLKE